jgi:hypothetical protein
MSLRADMCRQRAAEAKRSAARTQNPSLKTTAVRATLGGGTGGEVATSADSGGVLVSATAIFSGATCFLMFEIAIALIVGFAYAVRERVFRQNQAERRQGRLSEEERAKA